MINQGIKNKLSPNDDFYTFINNVWVKDFNITKEQKYIIQLDDFRLVQYKVYKELIEIMKQLVSALAFLQKNSISHRDMKPQNVLLFKDDIFKVADFGEAKQIMKLETNKQLSTLRGTELYMSPILFNALRTNQNDIKHNSYKSDVFSLGFCILYAATLNINVLYECRNLYDSKIVNQFLNKTLKSKFSTGFINVISKMLEINEENRYDFLELESIFLELEA